MSSLPKKKQKNESHLLLKNRNNTLYTINKKNGRIPWQEAKKADLIQQKKENFSKV